MEGVENIRERQRQGSCEEDADENTMESTTAVKTVYDKDKGRRVDLETLQMAQGKSEKLRVQDVQKLDTLYEV